MVFYKMRLTQCMKTFSESSKGRKIVLISYFEKRLLSKPLLLKTPSKRPNCQKKNIPDKKITGHVCFFKKHFRLLRKDRKLQYLNRTCQFLSSVWELQKVVHFLFSSYLSVLHSFMCNPGSPCWLKHLIHKNSQSSTRQRLHVYMPLTFIDLSIRLYR